jgi:hypothetical protein
MIFEDQIGARAWLFDHNTSSPSPTAYSQGWLEHTRAYSHVLLMTEKGFDRLAETEVGFHGSILLAERQGDPASLWKTDTWHPYPLAPLLMRDKVFFYQHDLAPETFTIDKSTLLWNMAFGYFLSYDLYASSYGGGTSSPWMNLVGTFQKHLLSHYAGEKMLNYINLQAKVTQTSFENFTVIANWAESDSYNTGQYVLPPLGVVAIKNDGNVMGGIFTSYNGVPLSGGDHYLIEERSLTEITVRQPIGADTNLTLKLLPNWNVTTPIKVSAFNKDGQFIKNQTFLTTGNGVTFTYQKQIDGESVDYYVVGLNRGYLPLIRK